MSNAPIPNDEIQFFLQRLFKKVNENSLYESGVSRPSIPLTSPKDHNRQKEIQTKINEKTKILHLQASTPMFCIKEAFNVVL